MYIFCRSRIFIDHSQKKKKNSLKQTLKIVERNYRKINFNKMNEGEDFKFLNYFNLP